jgi:Tfp pilus assembly protein PilF
MPLRLRRLPFLLCASTLLLSPLGRAQQLGATNAPSSTPAASTNAPSSALTTPRDAAQKLIADAIERMQKNDTDGAMNALSQALKLNPNSTGAYVLRASIYTQKKQWTQAEDDFNAAARIAPTNTVLKFNLVEIKFMQKQYDVARPGFAALVKDPDMGDFASYKVFLCDLFGGHEDAAKKELDVFNDAMGNPSYYFANAAWSLVHKNLDDARSWLLSASRIYPPRKNAYYAASLRDLGYLPIPGPNDKVTPPSGASTPLNP